MYICRGLSGREPHLGLRSWSHPAGECILHLFMCRGSAGCTRNVMSWRADFIICGCGYISFMKPHLCFFIVVTILKDFNYSQLQFLFPWVSLPCLWYFDFLDFRWLSCGVEDQADGWRHLDGSEICAYHNQISSLYILSPCSLFSSAFLIVLHPLRLYAVSCNYIKMVSLCMVWVFIALHSLSFFLSIISWLNR